LPSKSSRRNPSDAGRIKSLRIVCESSANLKSITSAVGLLKDWTGPMKISVQKNLLSKKMASEDDAASAFVALRLIDAGKRDERAVDSFMLRDFEKRAMSGTSRARGVPYEGVGLMKLYQRLLPSCAADDARIVITDRLIMTWSEDDLRYHARVVVFGFPSVISMSGIVEAPARPREYYFARQALDPHGAGAADELLSEQFSGRYVETDDERMDKILRGYILQCLFYSSTLDPFCKSEDCMLFNAHWQEEMIRAQVGSGRLCEKHKKSLGRIIAGEPASWS
jgi:hypothetical protein